MVGAAAGVAATTVEEATAGVVVVAITDGQDTVDEVMLDEVMLDAATRVVDSEVTRSTAAEVASTVEAAVGFTVVVAVADSTVVAVATAAAGIGNRLWRSLQQPKKWLAATIAGHFLFCGASLFLARMCVLARLP